jgi:quercetin 2,3-dioxygenase
VSNLDQRPDEYVCGSFGDNGPEELLIEAHRVWLGKTTQVARALPDRQLRMVGAWCFLDHYGPEDVSGGPGMRVWPHPHTGLQTVSWLLEGEIEHRDGLGSQVMVRPGELHVMTAGHGIVHSEMSLADKPPTLHGVQLWVARPDAHRDIAPQFRSHTDLPELQRPGVQGRVLMGEVDGVSSPAATFSPLTAADLTLEPQTTVRLRVRKDQEHGLFVMAGQVGHDQSTVPVDHLLYLGCGRDTITLHSRSGGRLLLLGGEPFAEELVMWWNFVGRSHDEIVTYRDAWERRDERFAPVISRDEKVMEAPPMPTVALRPRPRRPGMARMSDRPTGPGPQTL